MVAWVVHGSAVLGPLYQASLITAQVIICFTFTVCSPPLCTGKAYIDCSTVSTDACEEIAAAVHRTGAHFLEAPVSGSKGPAEQGQLIFLAAGAHIYEFTPIKCLNFR